MTISTRTDGDGFAAYTGDGTVIGRVAVRRRPDDRLALRFRGDRERATGPLVEAVTARHRGDLHTTVGEDDRTRMAALAAVGFTRSIGGEHFRVRFDAILGRYGRAPAPEDVALRTADTIAPRHLRELDDVLRQSVPGCEGWRWGDADFRRATHDSPAFDPSGYVVAADRPSGHLIGLARFRRHRTGPRLDLLAVRADHRRRGLGAALLSAAAAGAARWGWPTFRTENSTRAGAMRAILAAVRAERTGGKVDYVRRGRLTGLRLEPITAAHGPAYTAMVEECLRHGEGYPWNNASLALADFGAFAAELADEAAGRGLPDGVAPQLTYVLAHRGSVLGEYRLRPVIGEPYEEHNGHVGYNLRPTARGRGHGSRGLALALAEARRLSVPGVMITVEGDNPASARVIEKNGGRLLRTYGRGDPPPVRSFWIDLGGGPAAEPGGLRG